MTPSAQKAKEAMATIPRRLRQKVNTNLLNRRDAGGTKGLSSQSLARTDDRTANPMAAETGIQIRRMP